MSTNFPLAGVRVLLSGSIPDNSSHKVAIEEFVQKLASQVFREGGTLVHGSHPSFIAPLKAAAVPYIQADGRKDALVLVRARKYAITADELKEIELQREYASVEIIPSLPNETDKTLLPMREWLANRSDVVIAVGGRWYETNKMRAGVPRELEELLELGKPGFVVTAFGGAMAGYLEDNKGLLERLHNGLSDGVNLDLAKTTNPTELVTRIISQIQLLPLVRGNTSSGRRFRILALDGGGLRGAFTAAVLAKWDMMMRENGIQDLVKHFDLVAGTSTGAILAIGLGMGLTPLEILDFYRKEANTIFPTWRSLRHWLKSKHDSKTLRERLTAILQQRELSSSCCRLVIPTVRADHGVADLIVTPHSPDRVAFAKVSAVDAALASSAAPTYFDQAELETDIAKQSYLDGGVWANNPVLPAITEAVAHLQVPLERIDVLSVGTLMSESDFSGVLGAGKTGWASEASSLFFAAQESAAGQLADALLTKARHLRVNVQTPRPIELDNVAALAEMSARGDTVASDYFPAVRSRFLDGFHAVDWRQTVNKG